MPRDASSPNDPAPVTLIIDGWHTECGACGYGHGGWAASPALEGKPILTPSSRTCHGCGAAFTESLSVYTGERVLLGQPESKAA